MTNFVCGGREMAHEQYDYGSLLRLTPTNEEFADAARDPAEWIRVARTLRVGAYVLKHQWLNGPFVKHQQQLAPRTEGLLFTSLFLAALSLENVLKAVLVLRDPEVVKNGKLSFADGGHALLKLSERARFD